jgi:hypothetical protein
VDEHGERGFPDREAQAFVEALGRVAIADRQAELAEAGRGGG